jgi:hypothetical protein
VEDCHVFAVAPVVVFALLLAPQGAHREAMYKCAIAGASLRSAQDFGCSLARLRPFIQAGFAISSMQSCQRRILLPR